MGFYPIAPECVDLILKHLKLPEAKPELVSVLDPCAGEGLAIKRLSEGLEVKPGRVFAVELNTVRAAKCKENLPEAKVLCASWMATHVTHYSIGLVYVNPPFDNEFGGGRREEEAFLWRAHAALAPDGVLCMVCPQDQVKGRRSMVDYLDSRFEQLRVYKLPEAHRNFREIVVFGVKRKVDLPQDAIYRFGELTNQGWNRHAGYYDDFMSCLAVLGEPAIKLTPDGRRLSVEDKVAVYEVRGAWEPRAFHKTGLTEEELEKAVLASAVNKLLVHVPEPPKKRPPLPLSRGHTALLLAAGELNGVVQAPDGVHVVRGTSRKEEYKSSTTVVENPEKGTVTQKDVYSERIVMTIRAVDASGSIKTFSDEPDPEPDENDDEGEAPEAPIRARATVKAEQDLTRGAIAREAAAVAAGEPADPVALRSGKTPLALPAPSRAVPEYRSYKLGLKVRGEPGLCFNELRFKNENDADVYAVDLCSRFLTAVVSYEVVGCDDEPNR